MSSEDLLKTSLGNFSLLTGEKYGILPGDPTNGPFKATKLWYSIIDHLHKNVPTKCRRQLLKNYNDCFTGSSVVDTILTFLQEEASQIIDLSRSVTRDNAIRVCQSLLDQNVIEPTGTWRQKRSETRKLKFEDSQYKLFKFTSNTYTRISEKEVTLAQTLTSHDENNRTRFVEVQESIYANPHAIDRSISPRQRNSTFCNPTNNSKRISLTCLPIGRNLQQINPHVTSPGYFKVPVIKRQLRKRTSLSPKHGDYSKKAFVNQSTSNRIANISAPKQIWKEVALVRLLTVVDVPNLEPVINLLNESGKNTEKIQHDSTQLGLGFGSFTAKKDNDYFFESAEEILGLLSNGKNDRSLPSKLWKKVLFNRVRHHYLNENAKIIPESLKDAFVSILGLIKNGRESLGLCALQLTVFLFPTENKQQLYKLLRFMNAVIHDEYNFSPKFSNRQVISSRLIPLIFNHAHFGTAETTKLVYFMLDNRRNVFEIPDILVQDTERLVHNLEDGNLKSVISFCTQYPNDELERLRSRTLEDNLRQLVEYQVSLPNLSEKEKTKWLQKFRKAHPEIFLKLRDSISYSLD